MMEEAALRGHQLFVMHQEHLLCRDAEARAIAAPIRLTGDKKAWHETGATSEAPLADYDAVVMRKDPPFDMEYVYSTYLLELAEAQGARVFNRPRAIRDWNEKMSIARFPKFTAPSLVTRDEALIREFLQKHRDVILKPLDGMGGASIFRVRHDDPNLNVIIETTT